VRPAPSQRSGPLASPIAVASTSDSNAVRSMFRQRLTQDLPAWELVFFEVVRQVFVGCEERGVLLERIRHRYLNLRRDFERAWKAVEEFAVIADSDRRSAVVRWTYMLVFLSYHSRVFMNLCRAQERASLAEAAREEANRARLAAETRVMELNDELRSQEAALGVVVMITA
jgi:hypothetical protein